MVAQVICCTPTSVPFLDPRAIIFKQCLARICSLFWLNLSRLDGHGHHSIWRSSEDLQKSSRTDQSLEGRQRRQHLDSHCWDCSMSWIWLCFSWCGHGRKDCFPSTSKQSQCGDDKSQMRHDRHSRSWSDWASKRSSRLLANAQELPQKNQSCQVDRSWLSLPNLQVLVTTTEERLEQGLSSKWSVCLWHEFCLAAQVNSLRSKLDQCEACTKEWRGAKWSTGFKTCI